MLEIATGTLLTVGVSLRFLTESRCRLEVPTGSLLTVEVSSRFLLVTY